jgi:hypothetical protein
MEKYLLRHTGLWAGVIAGCLCEICGVVLFRILPVYSDWNLITMGLLLAGLLLFFFYGSKLTVELAWPSLPEEQKGRYDDH